MNKILFALTIVLISSCKSDNKNTESIISESQESNTEILEVNDKFQAFIEQFPSKNLPIKINGCADEIFDLPKLDEKLSSQYYNDFEDEYIYGMIPTNGIYILTITLGQGECLTPILNTYKLNGDKIDSKPISIGLCGPDPCYECVEAMTINSEYQIYVADTIKTSECDDSFNPIAGTEKIKVVYKEGKLTEKGIIELTEKSVKIIQ